MRFPLLLIPPLVAALLPVVPAAAQAPAAEPVTAERLLGRTVHGAKGVVLGVVERVVAGPGGRPAQVLVRPHGARGAGLRSLSLGGLTAEPDGLTTPLTRPEFEAMPPVDPPSR